MFHKMQTSASFREIITVLTKWADTATFDNSADMKISAVLFNASIAFIVFIGIFLKKLAPFARIFFPNDQIDLAAVFIPLPTLLAIMTNFELCNEWL